jgi:hypothetical protein
MRLAVAPAANVALWGSEGSAVEVPVPGGGARFLIRLNSLTGQVVLAPFAKLIEAFFHMIFFFFLRTKSLLRHHPRSTEANTSRQEYVRAHHHPFLFPNHFSSLILLSLSGSGTAAPFPEPSPHRRVQQQPLGASWPRHRGSFGVSSGRAEVPWGRPFGAFLLLLSYSLHVKHAVSCRGSGCAFATCQFLRLFIHVFINTPFLSPTITNHDIPVSFLYCHSIFCVLLLLLLLLLSTGGVGSICVAVLRRPRAMPLCSTRLTAHVSAFCPAPLPGAFVYIGNWTSA